MASDVAGRNTWPIVGWEEQLWVPSKTGAGLSRSEATRQTGHYRAAVPQFIAGQPVELEPAVVAEVTEASNEISRFDAEMGGETAPFAALLLRTEAASSSQIEHLTASARAIATEEIGEQGGGDASEIVANTRSMLAALSLGECLDESRILEMHRALMVRHPAIAGAWRTQQVWIGRGWGGPRLASFVPPRHDRVPGLMADLVRFVDREDVPTLAHAAVAHAQFETIHPFIDGNGRVGRALVHAMLHRRGLTRNVTVPVSAGLLADVDAYFAALDSYRQGDLSPIVSLVGAAALRALGNSRHLVADLHAIRDDWSQSIRARRDSSVWRAVDVVFRHPVVNHGTMGRELGSANPDRHLRQLVDAGVLVEFSGKRRNRLWRAPQVLAALDAFAERAGRRAMPSD